MKASHASTATVLAAEQDAKKAPVRAAASPHSSRGSLAVAAGVLLLLIGAAGAYAAYARYLAGSATPVLLSPTALAPIFVDESEEISGTAEALREAMRRSLRQPLTRGAVRFLYRSALSEGSVFAALELPAPDMLLRNIETEGGMAGVVATSGGTASSPFFILPVASYSETFAALLAWEREMPRDLSWLFEPAPGVSSGAAAPAVSAVAESAFRDEVVANHDARVYRDSAGREQLVYGYWSPRVLVIARDRLAFAEIIGRLATATRR